MKLIDEFTVMGHIVRIYKKGFMNYEWCAGIEGKLASGRAFTKSTALLNSQGKVLDYEYEMKEIREQQSRAARTRF